VAVLGIQWRSLVNSLRRRSERLGLVATLLVAVFWYGFWLAGAAALLAFAALAGDERLQKVLPGLLFLILLYWQLSPLLTASMGVSIDLRKLAPYPIGQRTLFLVECLLRLATGAELALLVIGLSCGAAFRHPARVRVFLPAVLLFLLFNVLLSAGLRNLLERLLQRRRLREFFLLLVVLASAVPQLILWSGSAGKVGQRLYGAFRFLPQSILPSTSLARAYLGQSGLADWLVLGLWCAAAGAFGIAQFRRSLRRDSGPSPTAASAERGERWADRVYSVPRRLLPDPLAALVEKELRYCFRSPRFRFLFLMGCSFGVVAWLPFAMSSSGPSTLLRSSFLTVLSLYSLLLSGQVTYLNSFGLDRSAARYFFWMPVAASRLLITKNLVAGVFLWLQVVILAAVCRLLRMEVGLLGLLEALAVTSIAALYLSSAGNLTSVLFASGLSPERVSRAGSGRGIQGLIVLLYPVLLAPILAAYFARYYWGSMSGFLLLLAVAAAGGAVLYGSTLPLAARLSFSRRERLLEDLSRGEGPLAQD